jgi:hypothetical protein
MADLGTDVGGQILPAVGKVADILMQIIGYIIKSFQERAQNRLAKDKHKEFLVDEKRREYENMAGYVNYKELKEAGVKLSCTGTHMTDAEFAAFKRHCDTNGILFTGVEDGNGLHVIMCKTDDLTMMNEVLVNMTHDKLKENAETEKQREVAEDTINERIDKDNDLQWSAGIKSVRDKLDNIHGTKSFDSALNNNVGYTHNVSDKPFYIVDAADPGKYVECHASKYISNAGKERVKTVFHVFDGKSDKPCLVVSDENMGKSHIDFAKSDWPVIKQQIKDKSGIGDCVIKIREPENFQQYRDSYKRSTSESTREEFFYRGSHLDQAQMIEVELAKKGYYIDGNGIVCSTADNKPVPVFNVDVSGYVSVDKSTAINMDAVLMGKQIGNLRSLAAVEQSLSAAGNTDSERINALKHEFEKENSRLSNARRFVSSMYAELDARDNSVGERVPGYGGKAAPERGVLLSPEQYMKLISDEKLKNSLTKDNVFGDKVKSVDDALEKAKAASAGRSL